MLNEMCPGCAHHCYLDAAHCERGKAYAATGVLPPRRPHPERGDRKPNARKMQYFALDQQGKLIWSIRELADMLSSAGEGLFACLKEEDRASLLMLLEKVRMEQLHQEQKVQ